MTTSSAGRPAASWRYVIAFSLAYTAYWDLGDDCDTALPVMALVISWKHLGSTPPIISTFIADLARFDLCSYRQRLPVQQSADVQVAS